jgi:hypothetical protein
MLSSNPTKSKSYYVLLFAAYGMLLASASAQDPQFRLNWLDRRPIGASFFASSASVSSNNPRGWSFTGAPNSGYLLTNNWPQFGKLLMQRASNEVQVLKSMNAQGVVFWDIGGDEIRDLAYYGDPISLGLLSPEMDAVADQMFSIYTSAGFRVGICIRAQQFYVGINLPASPTNGQVFVLASAPYGQKEYHCFTNGIWTQTTGSPYVGQQQLTNCFYTNFLAKIQYANSRWGATLFYVDSYRADTYTLISPTNYNTVALRNVMATYPTILLAPEGASYSTSTSSQVSYWWPMTAPYLQTSSDGYFTPTVATSNYPNAFSCIYVTAGYTNLPSLIQSVQAGNILFANSWYSNIYNNLVSKAYAAAQLSLQPPTDLHVKFNAP